MPWSRYLNRRPISTVDLDIPVEIYVNLRYLPDIVLWLDANGYIFRPDPELKERPRSLSQGEELPHHFRKNENTLSNIEGLGYTSPLSIMGRTEAKLNQGHSATEIKKIMFFVREKSPIDAKEQKVEIFISQSTETALSCILRRPSSMCQFFNKELWPELTHG